MMNINEISKISERVQQLGGQRRRQAVMFSRFCTNVKHPRNLVATVLVLILGWCACVWVKIPLPGSDSIPMLSMVWDYAVMILILLLSVLFALAILTMPPLCAKRMEKRLQHIGFTDRYGYAPALISSQGIKHTRIRELSFYSLAIAKETWEKRQSEIEDVLNVHFLGSPEYGGRGGNNRNYIVLLVAPGVERKRDEPLYDDEL